MKTITTYYDNEQSLKKFVEKHHDILFSKENLSVLTQVFCGNHDKDYILRLIAQIEQAVPHTRIIGATASGEIMNGKVSGFKTVLSFTVFKKCNIRIEFAQKGDRGSYALGRSIAGRLNSEQAKLLLLFSSGTEIDAEKLLAGVQDVNPKLPTAGGISAYGSMQNHGLVFGREGITGCGAIGAVLEGECLSVRQFWHLCWLPIGKEMNVTKTKGRRVYTIDEIPAFQVYQKYLGTDCRIDADATFPLITSRHGVPVARVPMSVYEDNSIEFSDELSEGEKVRFSYGQIEMILQTISDLIRKIKERKTESIFIYSCVMRKRFLQDSAEIETLPLEKIAPTVGFFTHGEFFHIDESNQLLNATMTTLALSETSEPEEDFCGEQTEHENASPSVGGHMESSNIVILKALTKLINTVTDELGEKTLELETANRKNLHASLHDSLTGLYNRNFFSMEMERLNRSSNPLSILMCDIDGLKFINDTLGHTTGDIILKATADILQKIYGKVGIVSRIGGDEFCVFILDRPVPENEAISRAVAEYNKNNPSHPLNISVGQADSDSSMNNASELFKEADNNMYREKLHRSQNVRSDLVQTLIRALEAKDILTKNHGQRLQTLMAAVAAFIGVSQNHIPILCLFARFHDIGKVGIPDSILFKPGPLTTRERKEMQRHSEIGFRIAQSSADLQLIADWILKHHEWWDGNGYPYGLKGESIPEECRLLAIIDAYDAMTSDRPYRRAMSGKAAIAELKRCAGTQFDPELVKQFILCLKANRQKISLSNYLS